MYQINFNSVVPIYEQIVRQAPLFLLCVKQPNRWRSTHKQS